MAEAQPDEPCEDVDPSRVWQPALIASMARFLPSVEATHTLRLVDPVAADELKEHKILEFSDSSEPIPPYMIPALVAHASRPRSLLCAGLKHRRQLVGMAAASGDLASLEAMIEVVGVVPTSLELGAAAAAGDLEACRWLLEQGCPVSDRYGRALDVAAGSGQRVACEWLIAHHGAKPFRELIKSIAAGCDLATLKRWWPQLRETDTFGVTIASAAASPTPDWQEKVAWLAAEGLDTSFAGFEAAACPDGASRLEWLAQQYAYVPELAHLIFAVEAKSGTAEAVEWIIQRLPAERPAEEGMFGMIRAVTQGSAGGSVAKLKALHEAGLLDSPMLRPGTGALLADALRCGYTEAVVWLMELIAGRSETGKFEPGASYFKFAATSGRVELLILLSALGWPLNSSAWDGSFGAHAREGAGRLGATTSGCAAALAFLAAQGCEMPDCGTPYVTAASNGDLRTLGTLRRLGMPFGPLDGRAFCEAVGSGAAPLPALKWLVAAGLPVRWGAAAKALGQRRAGDCEAVRAWVEAQRQAAGEEGEEPDEEAEEDGGADCSEEEDEEEEQEQQEAEEHNDE